MKRGSIQCILLAAAGSLLIANPVSAFDFGNMMNPSKWMGGNKDRDHYDDYYGGPGYGYGGPPGYGYGGPYGYGAPPGYGYGAPPGYGYGVAPGYGYGTAPGYGQQGTGSRDEEITRLRERLRQLEGEVK